jgi:lipoate-protein ligase A
MTLKLLEPTGARDPAESAALEEFCVRRLPGKDDLLLLYVNSPAVVIGRHQVPPAEADLSFLKRRGIPLVRRLSGGGAVFHDTGNINFAFVTGYDRAGFLRYDRFLTPVIEVLCRLGAPARFQPPNAISVDGKKFSGNAQFTDMRRMLTHGTLLFSADLDTLTRALSTGTPIRGSRGVASAPSPVTNLQSHLAEASDMDAFQNRFRHLLAERLGGLEPFSLSAEQEEEIDALAARYRSWEWTWGRTPRFVAEHSLPPEGIRLRLTVEGGIVREVEPIDADGALPSGILRRRYSELTRLWE